MKYCRAILGGYLFCFFMTGSMAAAQETGQSLQGEFCCNPQLCVSQLCYRPCRFSLSGYVGEGMGHDTRRASAEFFYAPVPDNSLDWHPFIDLRAHYLSHDHWAANAGLGLRWIDACERIWGANVFYDFRESKGDFNQVGVGVETLGPCWDFRVNFYYPVGKKKHFSHLVVFDNFIGNFKMTCREAELAKRGAGAEFGLPICRRGCSEIYLAFGPYYYKYKHRENFWGGMARVIARYTEYMDVEFKVTYDKDFHTKAQGIFTLTLPFNLFDSCRPACGGCLLWQPIVRNDVIILNRTCCGTQNF